MSAVITTPTPARAPEAGAATPRSADLAPRARALTEGRATTFAFACRLLPAEVREDVYLLYLVFRTLDDLVDTGDPDASARVAAVAAWAAPDGKAALRSPEVELLDELSRRHPLPRRAVADFCAGMRSDLERCTFATERDVDRYCYQVAGTVGLLMASVLGVDEPRAALPAAAHLGMAMQRTNILRDIDEDLAAGHVYLSDEALRRSGGSLAPGARASLLRAGIARADELYEDGIAGIDYLRRGRAAIALAARTYREILRELERRGPEARGRAVVPATRKLLVAARTVLRR